MINYDYTIYPDNSPSEFKKTCKKIESNLTGLSKKKLLVDVDGSTIQTYSKDDKDIDVFDDYDVGAVFVKSEINLDGLFSEYVH